MVVGILTVRLAIDNAQSLKDKRHVVKSILDQIRNKFNVSASEIDDLNLHRRAILAFACVSNENAVVSSSMNKILEFIEADLRCEVIDSRFELI